MSAKTYELLASLQFLAPLLLLAPCCANTVGGVSTVAGILSGLPSAVYICDVPFVFAAVQLTVANVLVVMLLSLILLGSVLYIADFSTAADFPTDTGGPAAVDIHGVPTGPAAVVVPDVNGVPAVVGLSALHAVVGFSTFASIRCRGVMSCVEDEESLSGEEAERAS
jgi:hypothetical protein